MSILSQQELERHLWGAADILRGTVDAGDYKQYIFGLLFYKRLCDVWDEEHAAMLAEYGKDFAEWNLNPSTTPAATMRIQAMPPVKK